MLLATRPSLFGSSSVTTHCPLCPQGPRGDDLSPALFFLFSQGFPLPPSCPLKRVGSDHLDVWALPRGQGGSEGGSCFLPPPFPQAHCAAFVPRLRLASSFPSCFCVLPPTPHRPPCPCPTPPQRNEMSAQDMGPIYVNPACPSVALVSLQPGPASAPALSQGLVLSPTSRAQSGCSHSRCSATLNQRCLFQPGRESDQPPSVGGTWSPLSPSLSSLDLFSVP